MATGPAVALRAVTYRRGNRQIIDGVDLRIEAGEHWALLGPNGAGKSTLLGICGARHFPTTGTAFVLGHQLGRVELEALRRRIGHVDPRHTPVGSLSIREVVLTGLTGSAAARPRWKPTPRQEARAGELLALVDLARRADNAWATLSQGERGRATIARALVGEPDLLILDEPSTGLDVGAREMLIDAVERLRTARPKMSSLLVTHHLEEVPGGTTHAALLAQGRVVAAGQVGEVLVSEAVSSVFQHPIRVTREGGRWQAQTDRRRASGAGADLSDASSAIS